MAQEGIERLCDVQQYIVFSIVAFSRNDGGKTVIALRWRLLCNCI